MFGYDRGSYGGSIFFFFNIEEPGDGRVADKCEQGVINEQQWLEGEKEQDPEPQGGNKFRDRR